jgi:hypothetical protein
MQAQGQALPTITITCRSGTVYQSTVDDEISLPHQALGSRLKLAGVDRRDELEVRFAVSISRFVLLSEGLVGQIDDSMPKAEQLPPLYGYHLDNAIEYFAEELVSDLAGWPSLEVVWRREQRELADMGFESESDLDALRQRLRARCKAEMWATGCDYVIVTNRTIPNTAMRKLFDYDCSTELFEAIKHKMVEHMVTYLELRHRGVSHARLTAAFAAAVQDLIESGAELRL